MAPLTRGSLSPAIYWRRRLFLFGLVAALVLLVSTAFGSGKEQDTEDSVPTAQQASGSTDEPPAALPSDQETATQKKGSKKNRPLPLPEAADECADVDVRVDPRPVEPVSGTDVRLRLRLSKQTPGACYWTASAETVAVKIIDEDEILWQLRDCPRSLTPTRVTVYGPRTPGAPTPSATAVWRGAKRSDAECSNLTDWVLSGSYSVVGAALGGEPVTTEFALEAPTGRIIRTPPEKEKRTHEFVGNQL